mmetsp:Transcript_10535/g.18629  ORF Transcript_10535/g.18629 Transcript_10535/m.18629 type:complete len:151 (-) Transcript_10535:327-779(-)
MGLFRKPLASKDLKMETPPGSQAPGITTWRRLLGQLIVVLELVDSAELKAQSLQQMMTSQLLGTTTFKQQLNQDTKARLNLLRFALKRDEASKLTCMDQLLGNTCVKVCRREVRGQAKERPRLFVQVQSDVTPLTPSICAQHQVLDPIFR